MIDFIEGLASCDICAQLASINGIVASENTVKRTEAKIEVQNRWKYVFNCVFIK